MRVIRGFRTILLLSLLGVAGGAPAAQPEPSPAEVRGGAWEADAEAVRVCREGLRSVLAYVAGTPEFFRPEAKGAVPASEVREALRETWAAYLDYHLALESIGGAHRGFADRGEGERAGSFAVYYAAFLAQYRGALELLSHLDGHAAAYVLLDEPLPELGLPERTFARFRFRYLNAGRATEFAALAVADAAMKSPRPGGLGEAMAEDAAAIWAMGKGRGEALTLKNALRVVGEAGSRAWLPVQAGVSQWMGDVKVRRPGRTLISPETAGPAPQLGLAAFLDGYERAGTAVEASEEEFRRSWRRPKWHVLVQGDLGGE
jgi:hypothetical protein